MLNCCWHRTLLHFGLWRSCSNIGYYHWDLHPQSAPPGLTPLASMLAAAPSYSLLHHLGAFIFAPHHDGLALVCRSSAIHFQAWSIWVVTHSLVDSDFCGHCPAVNIDRHPFGDLSYSSGFSLPLNPGQSGAGPVALLLVFFILSSLKSSWFI